MKGPERGCNLCGFVTLQLGDVIGNSRCINSYADCNCVIKFPLDAIRMYWERIMYYNKGCVKTQTRHFYDFVMAHIRVISIGVMGFPTVCSQWRHPPTGFSQHHIYCSLCGPHSTTNAMKLWKLWVMGRLCGDWIFTRHTHPEQHHLMINVWTLGENISFVASHY